MGGYLICSCYHTGTCINNTTCNFSKHIFTCYSNCTIPENNNTITNIINSREDLSRIYPEKKMYYCKNITDISTCFLTKQYDDKRCPLTKVSIALIIIGFLLLLLTIFHSCDRT